MEEENREEEEILVEEEEEEWEKKNREKENMEEEDREEEQDREKEDREDEELEEEDMEEEDWKEEDGEYPTIGRAPSSGSQIIAKPIRPCCGGCCGGSTSSAINEGNPHQHAVPICLLFIIFLFAAACVVAGIMFYLKSGKTPTGLFHGF